MKKVHYLRFLMVMKMGDGCDARPIMQFVA